jgi:uncharacterized protein (DUF1330 family)
MPAYLVSIVNVRDPDRYQEYATAANQAAAKHGGKFLLRGRPLEVVSEWESAEKARSYYHSPEYARAKAKRQGGVAEVTILLFEGA